MIGLVVFVLAAIPVGWWIAAEAAWLRELTPAEVAELDAGYGVAS